MTTIAHQIPKSVWDKIDAQVKFDNDAQRAAFLADALNTYVAFGQMVADGKKVYIGPDPSELARVHLPCEQAQRSV